MVHDDMVYRAPGFPEFVAAFIAVPVFVVHKVYIRVGSQEIERTVFRHGVEIAHGEHEG